ncbi:MAG: glycosyltransferase family 9 protein [Bacteroidales bacterium]|jgi:heptosyltransferase-2|nr:glycosyltransferase family 9 protein [Bacteroidales bacterium]
MNKILIIQTASIGDVILTTPLIENLHKQFPNSKIDFLLKNGNQSLFKDHPYLNEVIIWYKSEKKYKNLFNLLSYIRKNKYDLVVNVQRFFSSGILTAFSGAKIKIGFKKNPLSFLFSKSKKHELKENIHEIDRNLSLISDWVKSPERYVRLYPSVQDKDFVSQYTDKNFITISPASLWFTKQFPKERWIEFLKSLSGDITVYLLGGKSDVELCEEIIERSSFQNAVNLSGKLELLQSASLMSSAQMNYVNDSAPTHLASSVNAPVTTIFCSTVPEFGFGPLSEVSFIVECHEKLDCRPCGIHGYKTCPEKHFKCGYNINTDELVENLNYGKIFSERS